MAFVGFSYDYTVVNNALSGTSPLTVPLPSGTTNSSLVIMQIGGTYTVGSLDASDRSTECAAMLVPTGWGSYSSTILNNYGIYTSASNYSEPNETRAFYSVFIRQTNTSGVAVDASSSVTVDFVGPAFHTASVGMCLYSFDSSSKIAIGSGSFNTGVNTIDTGNSHRISMTNVNNTLLDTSNWYALTITYGGTLMPGALQNCLAINSVNLNGVGYHMFNCTAPTANIAWATNTCVGGQAGPQLSNSHYTKLNISGGGGWKVGKI